MIMIMIIVDHHHQTIYMYIAYITSIRRLVRSYTETIKTQKPKVSQEKSEVKHKCELSSYSIISQKKH